MQPPQKHSRTFRWIRIIIILICVGVLVVGGVFGYKVLSAGNSISTAEQTFFGQLTDLLFKSGNNLKGEQENRVNILLMAVGGEGHEGATLADTIMVASIQPKEHRIALLSIPRDLYVQVPNEQFYSKLNAVHALGEARKKNNGPELLRKKIEEITGVPIHYYARIDFTAFKKIVEAIGGVNIRIDNGFFDYWHKIAFPTGTETMNGDRALAYVRARYVEGPEGGDFKRTARQQQMLVAIRDKVFSTQTAIDFNAIDGIINSLSENIRTDMQLWEIKRSFEIIRQLDTSKIESVVLTTGPKGVLVGDTTVLNGTPASILKTRTGDYSEIQTIEKNIFTEEVGKNIGDSQQSTSSSTPTPTASQSALPSPTTTTSPDESPTAIKKPSLDIRNGTATNGLAKKVADTLKKKGYEITSTGNAHSQDIEKTTVYAPKVTQADDAQDIASILNASSLTDFPANEAKPKADILVVIGADFK